MPSLPSTATTLLLALFAGCSGDDSLPLLVRVSGRVTHEGRPVEGLLLHFEPTSGARGSTALTNAGGEFTLDYKRDAPGVIPGVHRVSVGWTPTDPVEQAEQARPDYSPPAPYAAILAKYGHPETTPLVVSVLEDTLDLELTLD